MPHEPGPGSSAAPARSHVEVRPMRPGQPTTDAGATAVRVLLDARRGRV